MRDASILTGELKVAGRLDGRLFALLEALDATGSLRKSARAASYSYKGAWMILEAACELAHQPLLETCTGARVAVACGSATPHARCCGPGGCCSSGTRLSSVIRSPGCCNSRPSPAFSGDSA